MRLNADILFDNLSQVISVELVGEPPEKRTIKGVRFCNNPTLSFEPEYVYIARTSELARQAALPPGVVFIVAGGMPPATYYRKGCVILCRDQEDVFSLFDIVQNIFDKYNDWEQKLLRIAETTADLQEMVDISFPIFDNPIRIFDVSFRPVVATSNFKFPAGSEMGLDAVSIELDSRKYNMAMREPAEIVREDGTTLSFFCNLFAEGLNIGCMDLEFHNRPQRKSDNTIAWYFARRVEAAYANNPGLAKQHRRPIQETLVDLLNRTPLTRGKKKLLFSSDQGGYYVCAAIYKSSVSQGKISGTFIIWQLETTFKDAICCEYGDGIVALLPAENVEQKLTYLLTALKLTCGLSCPFQGLSRVYSYYRQAVFAIEEIRLSGIDTACCSFERYKLDYMLTNSVGEFDLDTLLTPGLQRLIQHDQDSQSTQNGYVHTLRTFLNNGMNAAKTASDLYIHRSTLSERLQRINRLLGADLDDPDQRLYVAMMLYMLAQKDSEYHALTNSPSRSTGAPDPKPPLTSRVLKPIDDV